MTYIIREGSKNAHVDPIYKPLGELTQDEIKNLRPHILEAFFIKKTVNAKSKK